MQTRGECGIVVIDVASAQCHYVCVESTHIVNVGDLTELDITVLVVALALDATLPRTVGLSSDPASGVVDDHLVVLSLREFADLEKHDFVGSAPGACALGDLG